MSESKNEDLNADLKALAARLATREPAQRLSALSPESRRKVLNDASRLILKLIRQRAAQRG